MAVFPPVSERGPEQCSPCRAQAEPFGHRSWENGERSPAQLCGASGQEGPWLPAEVCCARGECKDGDERCRVPVPERRAPGCPLSHSEIAVLAKTVALHGGTVPCTRSDTSHPHATGDVADQTPAAKGTASGDRTGEPANKPTQQEPTEWRRGCPRASAGEASRPARGPTAVSPAAPAEPSQCIWPRGRGIPRTRACPQARATFPTRMPCGQGQHRSWSLWGHRTHLPPFPGRSLPTGRQQEEALLAG